MPTQERTTKKNINAIVLLASDPLIINTEIKKIIKDENYLVLDLSKTSWRQFYQVVCEEDMFNPVSYIIFNNLYKWDIKDYKENFEKLAKDGFAGKTCIFCQDISDYDYQKLKKLKEHIVIKSLSDLKIKAINLDTTIKGESFIEWLQALAKDRYDLDLPYEFAKEVIEKSHYKPTYAFSEIEKLSIYLGETKNLTKEIVDVVLKPSPVNDEMIFFKALSEKDKNIVQVCRQLFDTGLDPIGVLWKLESTLALTIWCKIKNLSPSTYGVKPPGNDWVLKDTQDAALLFMKRSLSWLLASYSIMVQLDSDLKNTVAVSRDVKSASQDVFLIRITEMCQLKD